MTEVSGPTRKAHGRLMFIALLIAVVLLITIASMLHVPAFTQNRANSKVAAELISRGAIMFRTSFTPQQGLGPLFNQTSCVGCHAAPTAGGMGRAGLATSIRIGLVTVSGFDPMIQNGGPVARFHSIAERALLCISATGI